MDKAFAIFDMDGTLIDSMPSWYHLAEEYLQMKGVGEISEEFNQKLQTMTLSEAAEYCVEMFGWNESPQEVFQEMMDMMQRHYEQDIEAKRKISAYLNELKGKGVRMCVASATAEPLMRLCLHRLGLLECFEFILSCESLQTSKRKPDIYLHATGRFNALPQQVAVFEDAFYAAQTAKNAGFYVVGVKDEMEAPLWEEIVRIADETVDFD